MENHIISFKQEEMDEKARQYFMAISGFNRNPAKFQDKLEQALDLREKIRPRIHPQIILSRFNQGELEGETLKIGDIHLHCKALGQLQPSHITDIYLYILTVGDVYWNQGPTINMLYGDMWGTSYVDTSRDRLHELVAQDAKSRGALAVSDSFGPGFYGMPVSEIPKFFQVLPAEKIGVTLLESALMLPLKTIAGIYVAVNEPGFLPGADCKSCLNPGVHCEFCHVRSNTMVQGPPQ